MKRRPISRTASCSVAVIAAVVLSLAAPTAATAAAPDPAALVSPPAGGTTASVTPTLSVAASDPDGGSVDVTFEGRELGATVPGETDAGPFSIVVVPDTQNYSYANEELLPQQLSWIRDSRAALDTAFVIQVGDLVSEWDIPRHWETISSAFEILDDGAVPNTVVPGNHDFDNATGDMTAFNTYFPPTRYSQATWNTATTRYGGYLGQDQFGTDPIDRGNADNYALFTAGGHDFLVLNLEWEAPQYALDWAERVMAAHPDRTVIMATHSFLTVNGDRMTTAQRPGGTSTAALWQDFVRTNCQIRLVVAGHANQGDLGEAHRTDDNACGQPVQQILTDYQSRANGGDGWLRYYTFDPAAATMEATTYSPVLERFETDANSAFTLPFDLAEPEPAPFTPIATASVPSGATASVPWSGLEHDTDYEWRAVVSDGTSSTTSATWTLRTPPEPQAVIAADAFSRSLSRAWGTADVGGPWTLSGGSTAPFSVDGTEGVMTLMPSQTRIASLGSVSTTDAVVELQLRSDVASVGAAAHTTVIGRQVGTSYYGLIVRFEPGGVLRAYLARNNTALRSWTSTWSPGVPLTARLSVTDASPTLLEAKLWPTAGAEPAAWQMTASDSTAAMQAAGTLAIRAAVSSGSSVATTRLTFDDLVVVDPTATAPPPPPPPANLPPTAQFTTGGSHLTITTDARGSTDPDGTIASYAWQFGDGGTASGALAEHTYAAAGDYTVALTVTDDDGATATATRTVTATAPAPPPPPPPPPAEDVLAADAFERSTTGGWGTADVGGAWTPSGGSTGPFSVGGGAGVMTLAPSQTRVATLGAVSTTDAVVEVTLSADVASAGGAATATIIGRQVGAANYSLIVRFEPRGVLRVYLARDHTALRSWTSTWTAGEPLTARLSVSGTGPTQLAASIWPSSGAAPATWQMSTTDSTAALQTAGAVAIKGAVSGSSTVPSTRLAFDDYRVTTD